MFNWLRTKSTAAQPAEVIDAKQPLTRKERLQAILFSYKTGKITVEQAVNLISVWRLTTDK